jgi:hypothetical protein
MRWDEVRRIYPNQFVKLQILASHIDKDKQYIDEVAVIGTVKEQNATKELLNCTEKTIVYHTKNENITLTIRKRIGLRRTV